jgi:hypothetical protein
MAWEVLCLVTNETIIMNIPNDDGIMVSTSSWRSKADANWAIKKLVIYYNDMLEIFLEGYPGETSRKFEISNHQPLTIFDFEAVKAHKKEPSSKKRRTKNVS